MVLCVCEGDSRSSLGVLLEDESCVILQVGNFLLKGQQVENLCKSGFTNKCRRNQTSSREIKRLIFYPGLFCSLINRSSPQHAERLLIVGPGTHDG